MLKLEPSLWVVMLYALACFLAVAGFVVSALSFLQIILSSLVALLLTAWLILRFWREQRGVLYFGESGCAWQAGGSPILPVTVKSVAGWSDWILSVRVSGQMGTLQLMVLRDNCEPEARRALRVYLLSNS